MSQSKVTELHPLPRDTLPPGACMDPTLCPGLEAVIVDLGVLRGQIERVAESQRRVEAQQSMLVSELRSLSVAIGTLLTRGT